MNNIPALLSIVLLVCNRLISKLSIGPLYFVDGLVLYGFFANRHQFVLWAFRFWFSILIFLFGTVWLVIDVILHDFDVLFLRRYAFSVYVFVPVFLMLYGTNIAFIFIRYVWVFCLVILCLYIFGVEGFSPSLGLQILALSLVLALVFFRKNIFIVFVCGFSFFFVGFGFMGQGLYKTPMLGLFMVIMYLAFMKFKYFIFDKRGLNIGNIIFAHAFVLVLILFFVFVPAGRQLVVEALYALSGLFDSNYLASIAGDLGDAQIRERGSSQGTAETRVIFWKGIFEFSLNDMSVLFFGNGHYLSFMDRIFPAIEFLDTELIEPHNSFLGCYYRYGAIGLMLLIFMMYQVRKAMRSYFGPACKEINVPCIVLAINYASFEVALESPHGAFIFWFIWMFPYLLNYKNSISTKC